MTDNSYIIRDLATQTDKPIKLKDNGDRPIAMSDDEYRRRPMALPNTEMMKVKLSNN